MRIYTERSSSGERSDQDGVQRGTPPWWELRVSCRRHRHGAAGTGCQPGPAVIVEASGRSTWPRVHQRNQLAVLGDRRAPKGVGRARVERAAELPRAARASVCIIPEGAAVGAVVAPLAARQARGGGKDRVELRTDGWVGAVGCAEAITALAALDGGRSARTPPAGTARFD